MTETPAVSKSTPTYLFSHWLFLRLLALVYFFAFLSLKSQILGLVGSDGVFSAAPFLEAVHDKYGWVSYLKLPTLFWFNSSDFFLRFACWFGAFLSVLLIMGFFEAQILFLLWFIYLSLTLVAREFLGFQWDILLLETGFLAIFFVRSFSSRIFSLDEKPSQLIRLLFYWLLFRLVFSSGMVKLSSGDEAWRHLTALTYHYETQPLPNFIAWYMHQLPVWFHKISVLFVFLCELIVPFFIFGRGKWRLVSFWGINILQVLILLTGNYCFFNLLAIAMSFLLIDDASWPQRVRQWVEKRGVTSARRQAREFRWPDWVVYPLASLIIFLSLQPICWAFRIRGDWPEPIHTIQKWVDPFRLVNPYGLFAIMTTTRQEIIIEGSNNQSHWYPYEFKYKPGDLKQAPKFNVPHQPRLDWQMWFAALTPYQAQPWFGYFLLKLLQGSPEVLKLLKNNPFPDRPPMYIRAVIYDYEFTDLKTKKETGEWWKRKEKGLYCPIVSLRGSNSETD